MTSEGGIRAACRKLVAVKCHKRKSRSSSKDLGPVPDRPQPCPSPPPPFVASGGSAATLRGHLRPSRAESEWTFKQQADDHQSRKCRRRMAEETTQQCSSILLLGPVLLPNKIKDINRTSLCLSGRFDFSAPCSSNSSMCSVIDHSERTTQRFNLYTLYQKCL